MQKTLIIVAYGDLIGYTEWSKQILDINAKIWPAEARESFMERFYEELGWFVLSSDFKVKYLGDGFMILRELGDRGKRVYDALRFLFGIQKLTIRINELIAESDFSPQGFRVRVVVGMANKTMLPDPNNKGKYSEEYSSPAIDLSERLLHIEKDWPLICHKSVVSLIGNKFKNVIFGKLKNVSYDPKRVDPEDAKDLWSFGFAKDFHIA